MTRQDMLNRLYEENGLTAEDVYNHKHYKIITRAGIDKIQANRGIEIQYKVIECKPDFAVVQAMARIGDDSVIQTFGSALKGDYKTGNCNTWYIMEMAEKRAMSRAVLKLAGLYAVGDVFGEDEAEAFKKSKNQQTI
ncbi:MAG: hypothetical protein GOVbin568_39 [Prokaryotic dsDNA virus sp.]|nr:MAG: hypothetical protein GOVbin568_39 [Prokaryotic dsDNA virus sp.]|tara:strand:+ start:4995 stop:5405 length:411 start_codon:yes stop_codon:yes gene_type:complete